MKEVNTSTKESIDGTDIPSSNFKNRRTLLKGSAVVAPAVLTLKSGSALALTSTQQCIARDKDLANVTNPPKFSRIGNGAPFLRTIVERVKLVEISFDTVSSTWFSVSGDSVADTNIYQHAGTLAPDDWVNTEDPQKLFTRQATDITVYATVGGLVLASNAIHFIDADGNSYYQINQVTREGLVVTGIDGAPLIDLLGGNRVGRFVRTSNLTGLDHITVSCWTSVNP